MIYLPRPRNTTIYKLGGTETFRASSSKWFGRGTNLQNIEKSMRQLYWADDGKVLVQVDQSGAEALIVSYLCEKGRFRDLFLNNVKPHVFVAMNVFLQKWQVLCNDLDVADFATTPIPELKNKQGWKALEAVIKDSDNWPAQERYYYIAKMICHASNYGMKGAAFQLNVLEKSRGQIVLTKAQADEYLYRYHSLFPEIQQWHKWVIEQLKFTGMLFNLQGYPRILTGRFDENDAKDWIAFCPQSTVGVITHVEITNEQKYIEICGRGVTVRPLPVLPEPVTYCLDTYGTRECDWDILANTHDSSLTQCPIDDSERCAKVKHYLFCQELTSFRGEKFRMKAEAQVGRNWAPRKEKKLADGSIKVENPEGLVEIKI